MEKQKTKTRLTTKGIVFSSVTSIISFITCAITGGMAASQIAATVGAVTPLASALALTSSIAMGFGIGGLALAAGIPIVRAIVNKVKKNKANEVNNDLENTDEKEQNKEVRVDKLFKKDKRKEKNVEDEIERKTVSRKAEELTYKAPEKLTFDPHKSRVRTRDFSATSLHLPNHDNFMATRGEEFREYERTNQEAADKAAK